MDEKCKPILWRQFGAAIDMLENAIRRCPPELWESRLWAEPQLPRIAEFWYLAFHALFWLDFYLTGTKEGFQPPAPFTLDEFDPAGIVPEPAYTPEQLLTYLEHGRAKCRAVIMALTDEQADRLCRFPWGELPFAELLLDNMRHVQEHGAQLNLHLGREASASARWVARTRAE